MAIYRFGGCKLKKYQLELVTQKDHTFYAFVADPREIVKLIKQYDAGEEQEAQRPWSIDRVQDISRYVAGRFKDDDNVKASGLIPNAPILNIVDKLEITKNDDVYYINMPENTDEFISYCESIEVIDGQHRIRAFMEEYLDETMSDDVDYKMIFSVFDRLSKTEKKELFMITNEKQKSVPGNLLRMFKRELNLLKGDEYVYDLVVLLNSEDFSPLKGRIMLGAKKLKKGYQESQLSKILNKSESFSQLKLHTKEDYNKMAKLISNYLKAWELEYDVRFSSPGADTITKISGLRYIFFLMPAVLEVLSQKKEPAKTESIRKVIKAVPVAANIENPFIDDALAFRGEGATVKLAKDHAQKLKHYENNNQGVFDLSEGI